MIVIFLDIYGVLNCIGFFYRTEARFDGYIGMDPELVARFNAFVKETGADVVLSSTWRLDPSMA
jgi:HAD domain in Swiss Army Knife RNA repair proteins